MVQTVVPLYGRTACVLHAGLARFLKRLVPGHLRIIMTSRYRCSYQRPAGNGRDDRDRTMSGPKNSSIICLLRTAKNDKRGAIWPFYY